MLTAPMPAPSRTVSKDAVSCAARSRTRNRNPVARSPRSIRRLRICWVVHGPSGFAVTPRMWIWRLPASMTNRQCNRAHAGRQGPGACGPFGPLGKCREPSPATESRLKPRSSEGKPGTWRDRQERGRGVGLGRGSVAGR